MRFETRKIKITDKNFLEIAKNNKEKWREWRTSTGKVFQDVQTTGLTNLRWLGDDPVVLHYYLKENPEAKVIFALIANCNKSYSRGKLKNVTFVYEVEVETPRTKLGYCVRCDSPRCHTLIEKNFVCDTCTDANYPKSWGDS